MPNLRRNKKIDNKSYYNEVSEDDSSDVGDFEDSACETEEEDEVDDENVRMSDEIGLGDFDDDETMDFDEFEEFTGKDGFTWYTQAPNEANLRTSSIERIQSGLLQPVLDCVKPVDFFNYIIDDTMVDHIYTCTNKLVGDNEKEITKTEIRAFIGLLILLGVTSRKVHIDDIWDYSSLHHSFWASASMTRKRFQFLCSSLRFYDNEKGPCDDKFYKMSWVFYRFKHKIKSCFEPGDNLTVDETLYPYRGNIFNKNIVFLCFKLFFI